jgi:phage RecT family recombinase
MPRIGITPESVARTALSAMYRSPKLMECDPLSVMRAIVEAASLGLTFALGRAYLVPFRNKHKDPVSGREGYRMEAQLIPGYQGLVDLVRRSTGVKSVVAAAVYDGDEFSYSTGLSDDTFVHVSKVEPDDAKLTHAYCIIRFLDGGYQWIVLTQKQINAVRARSKAGDFGPWKTDYAAMAIKSAVRRCTKLCPASIELVRALELDDRYDAGEPQELATDINLLTDGEETPAPPPPTATQRVAERLKAQKPPEPAIDVQPDEPPDDEGDSKIADFTTKLAADFERRLLDSVGGNKKKADVELSAATGGKIQKLADLPQALTDHIEYADAIEAYLKGEAAP